MFVTVCVNELNEGQADSSESVQRTLTIKANKGRRKQLYRVDLPMRARKELKSERLTRSSLSLLGKSSVIPLPLSAPLRSALFCCVTVVQ